MADNVAERTEKPTAKKVKDARERGQVARSRDLSAALSLAAATLALSWVGVGVARSMGERLARGLSTFGDHSRLVVEPTALSSLMWADAGLLVTLVGPLALVAALASIGSSLGQVGGSFSPKALELNWGRLSPASGFSRLAPMQSLPELGKAVFGMAAIGAVCYLFVRDVYTDAPRLVDMTPVESGLFAWHRLWTLLWRSSLALAVLAGADYGIQRWRLMLQLKMSRQEIRDEARLHEGNPEIKARVRRVQRDMNRRRMLLAVKTATVVITNPTHFAVALEYRRAEMAAPVVVAKGQDEMAARIRTIAREAGVPIVENVTLARALYQGADVGDAIPGSLFGAVAEVLAYLLRLKQLML